jgi:hypothetical protein
MSTAPSIGRIVHYHSYGTPGGEYQPEPRAAIITEIHWNDGAGGEDWRGVMQEARPGDDQAAEYIGSISLAVLNPSGMFFNEYVDYSEEPKPGCWSWPPRA